ncbi:hypothetical protein ACFL2A_05480 [Thermodesulfobacteriota bacterium]
MRYITIFCLFLFLTCPAFAEENKVEERYLYVSMINLIATPEKYYGKKIRVTGFAQIEFEWHYLHLSENDAKYKIIPNSIELELNYTKRDKYKDITRKYVEVIGIFGVYPNSGMKYLKNIEHIERLVNWFNVEIPKAGGAVVEHLPDGGKRILGGSKEIGTLEDTDNKIKDKKE